MQLCADCGNSFSTTEMMQHEGQGVCYTCYHKRKNTIQAAAAKVQAAAKKAGKRKMLIMLAIGVVVLIAGAVAAWLTLR
jgi:protein-arginine kinase activator protein McsA